MIRINNQHPRLDEFMESGNDELGHLWEGAKVEMKFNLNDMVIINASIDFDIYLMITEMRKIRQEHLSRYRYLCNEYLHECDDENQLKEAGL